MSYFAVVQLKDENDEIIGASNPLPIQVSDGTSTLSIVGDGDEIGTVKGIAVYGQDGAQLRIQKITPSGQTEVWQPDTYELLSAVLKELKKMNLHLALITDNYITNQEVE